MAEEVKKAAPKKAAVAKTEVTEVVKKAAPKKVAPKAEVVEEVAPKVAPKAAPKKKAAPKAAVAHISTGRRKEAIARVRLVSGNGKITINKRDIDEYFDLDTLKLIVRQPLVLTGTVDKYDVLVNVQGGGFTGQAGAIRHAIARELVVISETYKAEIKKAGFLTRDSRMKERKKYGLKKARKAPQFSKR